MKEDFQVVKITHVLQKMLAVLVFFLIYFQALVYLKNLFKMASKRAT
jgi:uncharacterized membrane protein (DUF373 family)